jgi:hypothetical protein
MAQKVLVQLVDDLDGTSSDEVTTVQFGLDGVSYEIDLNAANAERLRKIYADHITAGRRTGGRLKAGSRPGGSVTRSSEASQIREWALGNGFELSGRGRIPSHVVEAYQEAQAEAKQIKAAPKRVAAARKAAPKPRGSAKKA